MAASIGQTQSARLHTESSGSIYNIGAGTVLALAGIVAALSVDCFYTEYESQHSEWDLRPSHEPGLWDFWTSSVLELHETTVSTIHTELNLYRVAIYAVGSVCASVLGGGFWAHYGPSSQPTRLRDSMSAEEVGQELSTLKDSLDELQDRHESFANILTWRRTVLLARLEKRSEIERNISKLQGLETSLIQLTKKCDTAACPSEGPYSVQVAGSQPVAYERLDRQFDLLSCSHKLNNVLAQLNSALHGLNAAFGIELEEYRSQSPSGDAIRSLDSLDALKAEAERVQGICQQVLENFLIGALKGSLEVDFEATRKELKRLEALQANDERYSQRLADLKAQVEDPYEWGDLSDYKKAYSISEYFFQLNLGEYLSEGHMEQQLQELSAQNDTLQQRLEKALMQ